MSRSFSLFVVVMQTVTNFYPAYKFKILTMKHSILLLVMALVTTAGCVSSKESDNPFLSEYKTPFGVPPFDEIKVQHYQPAIEAGIQEQNREIEQIISNEEPASFENTILAYDQSGRLLNKTTLVFYNIRSANTNDELLAVAREVTPILTSHRDNIALNEALFQRIKTVYNERYDSDLDSSQIRVVEKYYSDFERNGANLAQDAQKRLREINNDLSMLTLQFGENSLAETNKNFRLVVESEDDLSGLSEAIKEAAAVTAKELGEEGKWVFTVQKPSMLPFLSYSDRRNLREKLYKGYYMRGDNDNNNDNKEIIEKMVALRSEKAKLLGYANHAEFVIDVNMAKTPENVYDFLYKLWDPALKRAKSELVELQKIANREGNDFKIKSWDWWYYAEKLRKEKYDLDESLLSPYLALDNVREGMFWVANQLYGISFYKLSDVPVYHPDVEVFEVKEENGDHIGLLYLDYFPRDGKGAGAWCSSFRRASYDGDVRIHPISTITCNFTKPTATTPSLLSWEETTTLFHEFGHALHGLFTDGKYRRTAGVVPRDYVELPSQVMENWAAEPEVLRHYAIHYATGEVIPDELIDKLQKSSLFNQGFNTTEFLAAALLDMDWHTLASGSEVDDVRAFEAASMNRIGLIDEILPRYRSTYFGHIFDGGYSAGYYVYYWAGQLDADAFNAFKESGNIFNPELAAKFRQHCLSEVGEAEGMDQYRKFRGQAPSIQPLLEKMGLN